jgi:hypothetical protein
MTTAPTYINYNPEDGQTGAAELTDMPNSVVTAANQVHTAGYRFDFNTTRARLLTNISLIDWTKVDHTILQEQNQTYAGNFQTDLATFIPVIAAANAGCKIWVQHNTELVGGLAEVKQKMDHVQATYPQVFGHGFIYSDAGLADTITAIQYAKTLD